MTKIKNNNILTKQKRKHIICLGITNDIGGGNTLKSNYYIVKIILFGCFFTGFFIGILCMVNNI
jgi:hypothetical protein